MRRRDRWQEKAARRRISLGGINLLPYRLREQRRRRAHRWLQGAGAAVCVCAWAAWSCLPDLHEVQRADTQRAEIERRLDKANTAAQSRLPTAGTSQVSALMASRALLLGGFEILGRLSYDGVRLHALHGDTQGFSMRIEARDPAAAQAWLVRLRSRWPAQIFDIEDLRAAGADASAVRAPLPEEIRAKVQALMLTIRMRRPEQPHAEGVSNRRDRNPEDA